MKNFVSVCIGLLLGSNIAFGASTQVRLGGGLDYSPVVDDGGAGRYSAKNIGMAYDIGAAWMLTIASANQVVVSPGLFHYGNFSRTSAVTVERDVDRFNASSSGWGGEVQVSFGAWHVRGGYGVYAAQLRKVEYGVERFYELSQGTGAHASAGYSLPLGKRMYVFAEAGYRQMSYGYMERIIEGPPEPTALAPRWRHRIVGMGGGLTFHL